MVLSQEQGDRQWQILRQKDMKKNSPPVEMISFALWDLLAFTP